jgi:hypothetical protein
MTTTTAQVLSHFIYNSRTPNQAIVAEQVITVREADRAAQELRKAYCATLA